MQWTGLNELREKYLSFFESKEHLRLPSFSLVPKDDKSLLLINSGMAPMKKYFTGEITPPRKRVTTCQKCIRTPDIERVGITARHGTFFEMLGNFSFGDYFKHEATAWAWEFFTKVLEIPEEKLYVSVYENDEEAYDIWTKEVGVAPSHMVHLGKEDNFWEHGSGPCGPCSEIYFDRGPEKGCGSPDCAVGCECDRYVEVWNLVFTQFENDGNGNYTPLDHPNIDTGMGLERLACVMQGVDNLFLVDTVKGIMDKVVDIVGVKYGESDKTDISLRVITDHIRSTTFMISDGVMPSNEGKGYVLRRLLRRAARHGRLLGYNKPFLYQVAEEAINCSKGAYPELAEKHDLIIKMIKTEEEAFGKTIDLGMAILNDIISKEDIKELSGEKAFKLNDTYGFPIDLTKEILAEKGIGVDEKRYHSLLAEQKERARSARKNAGADAWLSENVDLTDLPLTNFTGYTTLTDSGKVLAIIKCGERVESASAGDKVAFVLDSTPFYAESGGQIGDVGNAKTDTCEIEIFNTSKDQTGCFVHSAEITEGMLSVGDTLECIVDKNFRESVTRNHTGAHILQAALRKVLGTHCEQAGQLVNENRIRFDFTHFSALTAKELADVERLCNEEILKAMPVDTMEMSIDEAKKIGAMALFGEKYGDVVRVVKAGNFSTELCGGTHVSNTGQIGIIKILSESSVASGVRRIEAVTGINAVIEYNKLLFTVAETADVLKINNPNELVNGAKHVATTLKAKDSEISELKNKLATSEIDSVLANAQQVNSFKVMTTKMSGVDADVLRTICSNIIDRESTAVFVVASVKDGKATIACACGKEARNNGAVAGKIVKAVAQLAGGNGGGKPDIAMAGAKDVSKIDSALSQVVEIIKEI
ncbi:MAG: alanine--tRNA ligase [Acutalibacteraceae bacterium]|nr:alanine--tRNA ligase [Acutalibacteraceae bacterium]